MMQIPENDNRESRDSNTLSSRLNSFLPALFSLLFFLNAVHDALRNSAVADEVGGHMAAGYLYWLHGTYSGGIANFPLAHLLIALPVTLLGRTYELFTEQHLFLFRLPGILIGTLLGYLIYRFTVQLYDRRSALAALFLFSLSPNLLAHASLATLDFPTAFFVFLTIYALRRYVQQPDWPGMFGLSLALSCALVTKIQTFLLVPIVLLVLALTFTRLLSTPKRTGRHFLSWILLPLVAWVVINVVYLHLPLSPDQLFPPLFVEAFRRKMQHAAGGMSFVQVAYMCGRYSPGGWWYYFPFAVLVKTPLPTLLFLAIGLCRKPTRGSVLFVLFPAAAFLGAAMASNLNIGIRHILLIYPFLLVLAGRGAAALWSSARWRPLFLLSAAWYIGFSIWVAPHHLSFFNIPSGGPANGHRLLIGSNFDSGQNVHFLRRYIEEQDLPCKINPDPFHPTTGRIFVKANAFYGSYGNGGKAAYAWLKPFERTNQIAYTWFEYHVPGDADLEEAKEAGRIAAGRNKNAYRPWNEHLDPEERRLLLEEVELHLLALRHNFGEVESQPFRTALAVAFMATSTYDIALDELRSLIERNPGDEILLGLGSEIMVRWKVGTLNFEGDEYLNGFHTPLPADYQAVPGLETVAESAREAGIQMPVSHTHYTLGLVLEQRDRIPEAIEQYSEAARIASEHRWAAERLRILQAEQVGTDRENEE